ncbi:MAG: SMC-Scp complex subunit ScpB [Candidatus Helarchaeota archaeon]
MNHLLILEALLFIRGKKGVSIGDIMRLLECNDYSYALFLISQIESQLDPTVLSLKYNNKNKKFYLMIKPEYIDMLQNLNLIKPRLSKAATATLAVIILYHFRKQNLNLDFLKSIRGNNVKEHLRELHDSNYIIYNEKNETFEISQKLINEINITQVSKEIEKLQK